MGNSNTLKQIDSRYTEIRIQENELLSNLIVIEDSQTKELFMIKQMNLGSEIEYYRIAKELKQRKILSQKKAGKYLIQLKSYECKQFNEICGKTFKIVLRLQYLQTNLKNIYNDRTQAKTPFSEDEIIQILKSVVNSLIILNDNNFKNVHIYKESIFLTKNNYKLVDNQLSNKIHPYHQIINSVPTKTGTYLAPELLHDISKGNSDFYQTSKADIFTLAVITLQLCCFRSFDNYFDYQKKTVDIDGLIKVVENIQYTANLKNILSKMLIEQEEERVGLISLKEMLGGNEMSTIDSRILKSVSQHNPVSQTERTFTSRTNNDSTVSPINFIHKVQNEITNIPQKNQPRTYLKTYQPLNAPSHNRPPPVVYERQRDVLDQGVRNRVYVSSKTVFKPIQPAIVYQSTQDIGRIQSHTLSFSTETKPQKQKSTASQLQTPVHIFYQEQSSQQKQNPLKQQIVSTTASQQPKKDSLFTNVFNNKTYGKHFFSNGARYEGQFNSNNEFDGSGMLYYPDGKLCYSGSWKSNAFHGFGVLYNQKPSDTNQDTNYYNFNFSDKNNWKYYEGEFDQDKKQGFGTLFMVNGDKFSGCFKNDLIQGFGSFYLARQNRNINGIWIQNTLKK